MIMRKTLKNRLSIYFEIIILFRYSKICLIFKIFILKDLRVIDLSVKLIKNL